MLITIIIAAFFIFFLAKAILETIWGSCLVINGLFWHAVAILLRTLAFLIRASKKVVGLFRKPKPSPREYSMANALNYYFSNAK